MQSELKLVKEFRQKRAQMQTELDDIKESLFYAHKDHKDTMQKLEHKVRAMFCFLYELDRFCQVLELKIYLFTITKLWYVRWDTCRPRV